MARTVSSIFRTRRFAALCVAVIVALSGAATELYSQMQTTEQTQQKIATLREPAVSLLAVEVLEKLEAKGRAPKTGYERAKFGEGWQVDDIGCSVRNAILKRDLEQAEVDERCRVQKGLLQDPYTGRSIIFTRGQQTSDDVQIDHVVALSNAWQTGAQFLTPEQRILLSNDPLNLLAVDGIVNQQKSDADAATWLPPNKPYRCTYVARQIAVKYRYNLWVTPAEKEAMKQVLLQCPEQAVVRAE